MATAVAKEIDRNGTTPFFLRVFYRTGTFHRLDEYQLSSATLPQFSISTWPDCSLLELSHHITANIPDALPSPPIGTRLAFRLVFADTKLSHPRSEGPGRFMTRELGNVVIGSGLVSAKIAKPAKHLNDENVKPDYENSKREDESEGGGDKWESLTQSQMEFIHGGIISDDGGVPEKTLQDVRFVIGDFIECAILPPLANGDIAPCPESARNSSFNNSGPAHAYSLSGARGRGHSRNGSGGGGPNEFIHPSRADRVAGGAGGGSWRSGRDDFAVLAPRPNGHGGLRDTANGGGGGFRGRGNTPRSGSNANDVPVGEWRRGETVPDGGPRSGGRYGHRGGRGGGRW